MNLIEVCRMYRLIKILPLGNFSEFMQLKIGEGLEFHFSIDFNDILIYAAVFNLNQETIAKIQDLYYRISC